MAAVFLKPFFSSREVAEIKRLEEALWDTWKTDPGKVLRRCGYSLRLGAYQADYAFLPFGPPGGVQRLSLATRW